MISVQKKASGPEAARKLESQERRKESWKARKAHKLESRQKAGAPGVHYVVQKGGSQYSPAIEVYTTLTSYFILY